MAPLFPAELIKQEMISDRWVDISDEVRNIYSMWRPTDLMALNRRRRHQKFIKTGRLFLMEKLRNSMIYYFFFNIAVKERKIIHEIGVLMAESMIGILSFHFF